MKMLVPKQQLFLQQARHLTKHQRSFWPKSKVQSYERHLSSLCLLKLLVICNSGTGEVFRCDVIVNHISSIQIAMKTRELFIEDAPEEFYARASDDQGKI